VGLHQKHQGEKQMEWIKEALNGLVEADKLDAVASAIEKGVPKHFIPKSKFNELNEEFKLTKAQLEETSTKITQLSQQASSLGEYQTQIESLKKENSIIAENYKKQIDDIMQKTRTESKRAKLKESLLDASVHKDAIDLLVERYANEVELSEEGFSDIKPLIEKIKSEKAGLFITEQQDSVEKGQKKKNPPESDDKELRKLFGL
jgi:uncharacterized phage infection (PIP) family protein YhgE